MSLLLFVYCAQYLNSFAATNWELFATKPYFDANGAFISLIFSGPLLLNASAILVFFVMELGSLLVKVKRAELKEKVKKKQ